VSKNRTIVSLVASILIVVFVILVIREYVNYAHLERDRRTATNSGLVGDWKEYLVQGDQRTETSLRRISLNEDGNLVQTIQVELGVQCRMWVNMTDISFEDGMVEIGGEFRGPVSADHDSVRLQYENRRMGETYEFVLQRVRDQSTSRFLDSLEASTGIAYVYTVPKQQPDGLLCGQLARARIDTARMYNLVNRIRQGEFRDLHSLLISRNDTLVFEEYFGANGRVLGPAVNSYYRERIHQLASATKSVTSALVGIALNNGSITSVKQGIAEFFPDYQSAWTAEERGIQIVHLLTMTSGWEWNESSQSYSRPDNDANMLWASKDPLGFVFGKRLVKNPGTTFNYNSGGSDVLGEIVRRATGEPVGSLAEKDLFAPLGISSYQWNVHPSGVTSTSGGLSLRTRDLLKFGLLFLHEGRWNNQQIISPDWVKESTSPKVTAGSTSYGYQWWIRTYRVGPREVQCYYAMGLGGNFLSVFPDLDLVVASTAQDFSSGWTQRYYSMMQDYFLPAVLWNEQEMD